jgi:hypothetical protein
MQYAFFFFAGARLSRPNAHSLTRAHANAAGRLSSSARAAGGFLLLLAFFVALPVIVISPTKFAIRQARANVENMQQLVHASFR